MGSSSRRWFACAAAISLTAAVLLVHPVALATERNHNRGWVGTWTASPQPASSPLLLNGQTLRQIVHTSIGGDSVRIRLSNVYGTGDLLVGSARVAVSAGGAAIVDGTDRVLRFSGSPTITISAGTLVVSDPVSLQVPALGDLAVSIYLPGSVPATTRHDVGLQTNYVSTAAAASSIERPPKNLIPATLASAVQHRASVCPRSRQERQEDLRRQTAPRPRPCRVWPHAECARDPPARGAWLAPPAHRIEPYCATRPAADRRAADTPRARGPLG